MSPSCAARERWDAIVIGSGAGGAAAAYRLAIAGLRILVLEKGARLPRDGSTLDITRVVTNGAFLGKEVWSDARGGRVSPEEHFNLGGKTKWYGAALLRFAPAEFEAEAGYAARGWPIRCSELTPYYEQAEQLLGVRTFACEAGLQRILSRLGRVSRQWQSTALPMALSQGILQDRNEAAHFDGFASVRDLKGDAETSLLARIAHLPHVEIRTDAEVVDLLPAEARWDQIAGARLKSGEELRASAVLMGAGALHSPRLLRRYVTRAGTAVSLPGADCIGRNLKLHVLTALVAVSPSRQSDLLRKTMLTVHESFPHSSLQPLGFDAELLCNLVPRAIPRWLARQIGARAYGFFLQTEDGSHADNRIAEQPPEVAGDPPTRVFDYDVVRTPASLQEHRGFTRAFQRDLMRAGLLSITRRTGLSGTAHACGTLIAGRDPGNSVVDAAGRVHALAGLYVVDGSILPRSSRVNPSLTIYAWSLRVADQLARSLAPDRSITV